MNKLVRYWNQNRGKIIMTIAIIAFIIIIIQLTNNFLKNREKEITEKKNVDSTKPVQSIITGEIVSEEITNQNTNVIKEFVDYCNNKEYEKAFNILSNDCKEIVFSNDIDNFKANYCDSIFITPKTYELKLWLNGKGKYTYQIRYNEDNLLATGGKNLDKNIEDYVTIIKENDEEKLNINGFIQKNEINKSNKKNDVEITINSKIVYKNYETYDITIKNYTSNEILISDGEDNKSVCLIDDRDVEYSSFIYEIPVEYLTLKSLYQKRIQIRFDKIYDLNRNVQKIQFKDIILNYDKSQINLDSTDLQRLTISVDI